MAFNRASGYTNLAQGNFVPVIYSQKVLKFFRKASVAEDVTNTDYYGEISNFGDTVQIIKEPTISVSTYNRGTTLVPQDLVDDNLTLTVDQGDYFSFKVDDIEEKHSHVNWQDLAVSSGAYALKDAFDADILDQIEQGMRTDATYGTTNNYGTETAAIDIGFDAGEISPLNVLSRLSRLLDDQNVPEDNRWVVAKPVFWEIMADENSKLMAADFTGDSQSPARNGRVTNGLIRGFRCYKSNNVPTSTTTTSATSWTDATDAIIAGHMSSTATASHISTTEVLRDQNSFADIVRGLHVYGRKVLRPEALTVCYFKYD